MNAPTNNDVDEPEKPVREEWWVAGFGDLLVWARLRELESGSCEIFDCDGQPRIYADTDMAHQALLDADFHAFDGLDEDDANALGFSLEDVLPPESDDDENLSKLMMQRLNQ